MMIRLYVLVVFSVITSLCHAQSEILIWSDEFDGVGAPNVNKWNFDLGRSGWGNNEVQNYTNSELNVRQENGSLIIEAIKNNGEWTSARILTQNKFSFKYGRIVFRAKLPEGSGTWPALWMLGENIASVGWPTCGEIDVMEHVGKNPGVVQSALHTPASFGDTHNKGSKLVADFNSEFHQFEAEWGKDRIDFKIDNEIYYTFDPSLKDGNNWPFKNPFFIIMNLAMGGNFGSDPKFESKGLKNGIDPSSTRARMEIDFVRVYSKEIVTGSLEENAHHFSVTPNPATSSVVVTTCNPGITKFQIQDSKGGELMNLILENETTIIDCSEMSQGLYFFKMKANDLSHTEKIFLQQKM